jgi:hypothetical protein
MKKKLFHTSLLLKFLDPGSGMGKNSGSGINIPDPQHWFNLRWLVVMQTSGTPFYAVSVNILQYRKDESLVSCPHRLNWLLPTSLPVS